MNVFAYGSLVVPDVMRVVTGNEHAHERATLEGFARFLLVDRVYPGIVPCVDEATEGRVYFDVEPHELERLDWFEAHEYEREVVQVRVGKEARHEALAYVIATEHRSIVSGERWDEARFVAEVLPEFLEYARLDMQAFEDQSR